ncbi:MAG: alpha/beta hydrolase [Alphaproteobacteria bacterium]|nr:alpha/beta hydrolase [Alphaproteobacteria bacterium]
MLFEGFRSARIDTGEVVINLKFRGSGRPILLLHGYPQTHAIWHNLAPRLVAENYTVVVADLRGYGDSSMPIGLANHSNYSKRAMAGDQVKIMQALGFDRFDLVGHDRGARVAHRMVLDHPERVRSCTVMDVIPTLDMYRSTNMDFARAYYHWFFLIQPFDIPERLIGSQPEYYLRGLLDSWSRNPGCFREEAVAEYVRSFLRPGAVHASCEDYRAAATIDLEHDEADRATRIEVPMLALWGAKGTVGRLYDVLAAWRERARNVEGLPLPCGHFVPEEAPEETGRALSEFLARH